MKFVYLAIFFIFTSMHLYASWNNNKPLRNFTKGYILLSLLGFYLETANNVSWIVIVAILASWLGDLFLIPKGVKWFTIGGIFFMASHIFFILAYKNDFKFENVPIYAIVLLGLAFASAVVIAFTKLKEHLPNRLFIPMFVYLLINGTMNCFAMFRMIGNFCTPTLITAIGALFFFASDTLLFFVRFNKNCRLKSHFSVMLTYSLGELLIIIGLALL